MSRFDGRELDQMRPVSMETAFARHAEGSCLIKMENTWVPPRTPPRRRSEDDHQGRTSRFVEHQRARTLA